METDHIAAAVTIGIALVVAIAIVFFALGYTSGHSAGKVEVYEQIMDHTTSVMEALK